MPEGSAWLVGLVTILLAAILCMTLPRRRKGRMQSPTSLPSAAESQRMKAEETANEPDEPGEEKTPADEDDGDAEDEPDELDWSTERDAQTWRELGWELKAAGCVEDAVRAFRCALDALEEDQAESAWELHQELGALYIQQQLLREAQQHAVAACACAELAFGSPSAELAESLNALGVLLEQMGNWNQARTQYHAALSIEQAVYGEASKKAGTTHSAIARMSERLMDRSAALKNYLQTYYIFTEECGYSDPDTQSAREDVQRAYRAEDRDLELFEEWLNNWQPEE